MSPRPRPMVAAATKKKAHMQRLRSPFRLRPGPGSEQRKGKGRKEEQQPPDAVAEGDPTTQPPGDHERGRATPGTAGPQVGHTITGASLRKRRADEEQRNDATDPRHDPSAGSE